MASLVICKITKYDLETMENQETSPKTLIPKRNKAIKIRILPVSLKALVKALPKISPVIPPTRSNSTSRLASNRWAKAVALSIIRMKPSSVRKKDSKLKELFFNLKYCRNFSAALSAKAAGNKNAIIPKRL